MGWDAYTKVKTDRNKKIFRDAANNVKNNCSKEHLIDWMVEDLQDGWLDSWRIRDMINKITPNNYGAFNNEWSAEDVRQINKNAFYANQYLEDPEEYECAYYVAKYFIEACAKSGLKVYISY